MSDDRHTQTAVQYVQDMFEARDTSRFDKLIADHVLYRSPVSFVSGIEALKEVVNRARIALPDSHMSIDWTCCDGNRVVVRGVHRGLFVSEFQGLEPTGRRFVLPMLIACAFENGLISDIEVIYDTRILSEQTGQPIKAEAVMDPPNHSPL